MKSLAALETLLGVLAVLVGIQVGLVVTGAGVILLLVAAGLWVTAMRQAGEDDDDSLADWEFFRQLAADSTAWSGAVASPIRGAV